jgi:uncharacterized protein YciW
MGSEFSPEDILNDFKTFYYDTALSSHESTLAAMQSFVSADRLVFGTDFPGKFQFARSELHAALPLHVAVSRDMAVWYTKQTNQYYADPRAPVWRENALKILANMEQRNFY